MLEILLLQRASRRQTYDLVTQTAAGRYFSRSSLSLIFSHSLSVLTYPELSPWLDLLRRVLSVGCGLSKLVASFGGGLLGGGMTSVSVSLSPTELGSNDLSFPFLFCASSLALATCSSPANQLIDHHSPPQRTERTMKCTLWVAIRSRSSSS